MTPTAPRNRARMRPRTEELQLRALAHSLWCCSRRFLPQEKPLRWSCCLLKKSHMRLEGDSPRGADCGSGGAGSGTACRRHRRNAALNCNDGILTGGGHDES